MLARIRDEGRPAGAKTWRVAHLSDVHVVGERYGFRIESGRSGPRGNERLKRVLAELEVIHAKDPLDLVLISGDMTDHAERRLTGGVMGEGKAAKRRAWRTRIAQGFARPLAEFYRCVGDCSYGCQ